METKKTETDDGGAAFPHTIEQCTRGHVGTLEAETGMSLLDYLAGQALQGFCANPAVFQANGMCGWSLVNSTPEQLCGHCYFLAQNMLRARLASAGKEGQQG